MRKLLFLISVLCIFNAYAGKRENFNQLGLDKHRRGQFSDAMELFTKEIEVNPKNAIAYYNFACALSKYDEKEQFGGEYYLQAIQNLQKSIELDPSRIKRAAEDSDLKALHGTIYFRSVIDKSLNLKNEAQLKTLIEKTIWTSIDQCGGGLFDDQLSLLTDGVQYGCRNAESRIVLSKGFEIKGSTIRLIKPIGNIQELRFSFNGFEGEIGAFSKKGKLVVQWFELSGYRRSP